MPPLFVSQQCTVTLSVTTQQGCFRDMRRVYSRSSAQMKNSPMGRPTSRTTETGTSNDTNVAAPQGIRRGVKSVMLRSFRSRCTFMRQIEPSVHSTLPERKPKSPISLPALSSASRAVGWGMASSSMIHAYW